jgi:predicted nucleic acid-binding protein
LSNLPSQLLVVDASIALTWAFEDENSDDSLDLLRRAESQPVHVPVIWWFEISNAISFANRGGRISEEARDRFFQLLERLRPATDQANRTRILGPMANLSKTYGLTVYDASYLELSIRLGAQLATLDKALVAAAPMAGVSLITF